MRTDISHRFVARKGSLVHDWRFGDLLGSNEVFYSRTSIIADVRLVNIRRVLLMTIERDTYGLGVVHVSSEFSFSFSLAP